MWVGGDKFFFLRWQARGTGCTSRQLFRYFYKARIQPVTMDYGAVISESIEYTREALVEKWTVWLVFILCSLPFALIQFVYDPKTILAGKTFHWELIPWPQIIALVLAGFLLSFIISGYLVRVYRGITPPPGFDNWASLYLDGIKLAVVGILWVLPAMLVGAIAFVLLIVGALTAGGSIGLIAAAVILLLAAFVLVVITILYSILGNVRFARTGSIREGIRFSAITATIRAIGWGTYIIALIVLFVTGIIFTIVVAVLSFIPFVGWVIQLVLTPLFSVFSARYVSRLYDQNAPPAPAPAPAP